MIKKSELQIGDVIICNDKWKGILVGTSKPTEFIGYGHAIMSFYHFDENLIYENNRSWNYQIIEIYRPKTVDHGTLQQLADRPSEFTRDFIKTYLDSIIIGATNIKYSTKGCFIDIPL